MNLKSLTLLSLSLFTHAVHAHPEQPSHMEKLFNQEAVKAVIDVAFETKNVRYTEFATLFNLCQKVPDSEQCGEEYDAKRKNYEIAKANHDVLLMANHPEFIGLLMPPSNYPELTHALKVLGYLNPDLDDIKNDQVLSALNYWLKKHDFSETEQIYFMHALLVRTEELSMQLKESGIKRNDQPGTTDPERV